MVKLGRLEELEKNLFVEKNSIVAQILVEVCVDFTRVFFFFFSLSLHKKKCPFLLSGTSLFTNFHYSFKINVFADFKMNKLSSNIIWICWRNKTEVVERMYLEDMNTEY